VIERRSFLGALASSLAAPFAANGQPTDKIWRLGFLGSTPAGVSPESDRLLEAFLYELRHNGFVEGKNLILERRALENRHDRAPAIVAELIGLRVDVLVIVSNFAARAAQQATTTIPIVMPYAIDPVAGGLVYSLARPGRNVTGMTVFADDMDPKRLELLKTVAPKAVRVAVVQAAQPGRIDASQVDDLNAKLEAAARYLGISLVRVTFEDAATTSRKRPSRSHASVPMRC
jgi:putative tryptophan/tyrosine transport system substrate-binding protein